MLRRSVSRHAKPCAPSDIQVSIPYLLVHLNYKLRARYLGPLFVWRGE